MTDPCPGCFPRDPSARERGRCDHHRKPATEHEDVFLGAITDCQRQKAMYEASLTLAVDLLIEWNDDELDADSLTRLRAETRSFLMNVPVGGRL